MLFIEMCCGNTFTEVDETKCILLLKSNQNIFQFILMKFENNQALFLYFTCTIRLCCQRVQLLCKRHTGWQLCDAHVMK